MITILQVLLGLALINYLMFDLASAASKPAAASVQLQKALLIAGATAAALIPTLLLSALIEQVLMARFEIGMLSIASFCVILTAVVQCIGLILTRHDVVSTSALPVFMLLVFADCIVIGFTMPPNDGGMGAVLIGGLIRNAGFALTLAGFTMFHERLAGADVPAGLRGAPVTFIAAAFLSMIFMGFAGLA